MDSNHHNIEAIKMPLCGTTHREDFYVHFQSPIDSSIYQYRLAAEVVLYYWAATPSPLLTLAKCHNYHLCLSVALGLCPYCIILQGICQEVFKKIPDFFLIPLTVLAQV